MQPPFKLKRPKVKPVHVATGIFIAQLGGYRKLELLNRIVMHQPKIQKSGIHKGRVHPDDPYSSERVYNDVLTQGLISERISRDNFEHFRRAAHQLLANDQAAFHAFAPHRPFGNDYSTCEGGLVTTDASHPTDGGLGAVVKATLQATADGRKVLEAVDRILSVQSSSGALLGAFTQNHQLQSSGQIPELNEGLRDLMAPQTLALSRLVQRIETNFMAETRARLILIGICLWILCATLRWSGQSIAPRIPRLLLGDFTEQPRRPLRRASWISVLQARRQLNDYKSFCLNSNPPLESPGAWADLFDYLGKRCGLIQPRSDTSRARKFIEPLSDTVRVMVMSCFAKDETLLPFVELCKRLRETWHLTVGGESDDPQRFRDLGFGNLHEDQDIGANVRAFRERLEELQLAARLSDGEHRCAALPEDLP